MDSGMDMGGASTQLTPLSSSGVNFSNETQAMDFLSELLDDTVLQVWSNAYARYFWYGTVVVVAIGAIFNFLTQLVHRARLRAAAAGRPYPAKPANVFTVSFATLTALLREATYLRFTPLRTTIWFKVPSFGTIILLLIYLGSILVLEFTNDSVPGGQHYQSLGIRAGWLAVAQVPLVILLAGKNNLIGLFTGQSFERLNVLHRWVSRGLLLLATLHFGYQSYGWKKYNIMQLEWDTDSCPPTGIAAYAILLWLNFSSLAPLRNWSYEFFVAQHLLSFFGFIIAVMMHLPSTALYSRVYIYIAIGLYLGDRLIRTARGIYHNIRPGSATLTTVAEADGVTKIIVRNKRFKSWKPGAYVLLSIPKFGILQSHPVTIASTPTSHNGDMIFLVRRHGGFTKRCLEYAETTPLVAAPTYRAFLDGPYGSSQSDFAAFDTALLVAGGTGITFCISILLDMASRSTRTRLPLRNVRLVWIVKTIKLAECFASEFSSALSSLLNVGIDATVDVYTTCDSNVADTKDEDSSDAGGCPCDKSGGTCCCSGPNDADFEYSSETGAAGSSGCSGPAAPAASEDVEKTAPSTNVVSFQGANYYQSRPSIYGLLYPSIVAAQGETAIAVCGPAGLSTAVRRAVVTISDDRAVHKGTGAQGLYLHVEEFAW